MISGREPPARPSGLLGRKGIRLLAGGIVSGLSLAFIFTQLWRTWPQVSAIRYRPLPTILAMLLAMTTTFLGAWLWQRTLINLRSSIGLLTAVRIWVASQLARYIPGNVWHLLGRLYLSRDEALGVRVVSLSLILELLQTITAALAVAAVSLSFWPRRDAQLLWLLLLVPLAYLYVSPRLIERSLERVLRRLGREAPQLEATIRTRDLFSLLPGYCAIWILYGVGLYLLALSTHPLPPDLLPALTGSFAIAWVAGFLSFVTPSGLGVREGVLAYLLSFLIPLPDAVLLALLARAWLTFAELACAPMLLWRPRVGQLSP